MQLHLAHDRARDAATIAAGAMAAFPTAWDEAEIRRAYATDPALDRNFFQHPPHRVARIRDALALKADATLAITRRRASDVGVPAAGAR